MHVYNTYTVSLTEQQQRACTPQSLVHVKVISGLSSFAALLPEMKFLKSQITPNVYCEYKKYTQDFWEKLPRIDQPRPLEPDFPNLWVKYDYGSQIWVNMSRHETYYTNRDLFGKVLSPHTYLPNIYTHINIWCICTIWQRKISTNILTEYTNVYIYKYLMYM